MMGSISDASLTILILASASYGLKAAGPLALGGDRQPPPVVQRLALLLPVPLLAAMVVSATVISAGTWSFDARLVGLAAAAVALWRKMPFVVVVIAAAAATAATRAVL